VKALFALRDLKFDLVALVKGLESIFVDGGIVDNP
jgi:hypothetical protein